MTYSFYKYQGTGNDFVCIDNRQNTFNKNSTKTIALICDRRFGIGADGLILLEHDDTADFKMIYFNADGKESSMCGNGGRCIVAFAQFLKIIEHSTNFNAVDGLHSAIIEGDHVKLQMQNVSQIENYKTHQFLDTGSPHHVQFAKDLNALDVKQEGAKIRWASPYNSSGSNVNFVEKIDAQNFAVRTYERGVEDETLSCGTGVTAVALAMHKTGETQANQVSLKTLGGQLVVSFDTSGKGYKNIWLEGPAIQVFKGEFPC